MSPPLSSTLAPASGSFFSSAIFTISTPQSLSHTLTLLSPLFSKPRALLQSESHNDLPFCQLFPVKFAFVIYIAIREQTGTVLSQSFVCPWACFPLFPLAFSAKAIHARRVFWNSFRLYFYVQGHRRWLIIFPRWDGRPYDRLIRWMSRLSTLSEPVPRLKRLLRGFGISALMRRRPPAKR